MVQIFLNFKIRQNLKMILKREIIYAELLLNVADIKSWCGIVLKRQVAQSKGHVVHIVTQPKGRGAGSGILKTFSKTHLH